MPKKRDVAPAAVPPENGVRAVPQFIRMMELEINGARRGVAAAAETPLLYVLRNDLGLVGTRFGCGSGQCGACMVLVDGRAVASCDLPIESLKGKSVTTIEGLGGEHPVQKALERHQAAQCGYCMSGIVMAAVALLSSSKTLTEAQVRSALDKNLCRCGSHNRVVRAILDAR